MPVGDKKEIHPISGLDLSGKQSTISALFSPEMEDCSETLEPINTILPLSGFSLEVIRFSSMM